MGDEVLKDDGAFWMQWEDFVVFWKDVQVRSWSRRQNSCRPRVSKLEPGFEIAGSLAVLIWYQV